MTRDEADEILSYIAQNLISPMAFDNRKASEVWLELSGEKFNQLCEFVNNLVKDPCIGCPFGGHGSEHCIAVIGDYCRATGECIVE